jgi:YHS domain-containing protein
VKQFLTAFLVIFTFVSVAQFAQKPVSGETLSVADDKAINKKCPVDQKDVDGKTSFTYKEQVIGFCSAECKGKFEKEPEKYIGKVKEFKNKKSSNVSDISFAGGDPINKKCPVSGKDVNPTKTVEYEKQVIGFCCDDCKGKFESDPKKYIGKVKEFKKK